MRDLSGITHAAEHASAQVQHVYATRRQSTIRGNGSSSFSAIYIPVRQLLPADQGACPRIGAGGEETMIHSGGNAA